MSDLKPCPFCGSSSLVYNSATGRTNGRFVRCIDCNACRPLAEDDALAKIAWNEAPRRNEVVELPEDAGGVPILVGDVVYDAFDRMECSVYSVTMAADGWHVAIRLPNGDICHRIKPNTLTHVAPDSLESIEKDIYHLVMSEYLDDPEGDVKAIMERIEKLTKEEE